MTRVAVVGECMVELRRSGDGATLTQTFSGDTYNAAVYLKRSAPPLDVVYISALGDDSISAAMRGLLGPSRARRRSRSPRC